MLVESLLASLLLMGGSSASAMSFDDIDSYQDAVAETAVSNIGDNYLSDVPDEEETMLLSESSSSSDSNSLQCSLFTYNYYGTRMAASNTNASGMYYNSNATPDVNYFSVMSLNVNTILSQCNNNDWDDYILYLNVSGSLSATDTAYYVYDNIGQQSFGNVFAENNTIRLAIEINSSESTNPMMNSGGYINLSIFHFTHFPAHENLSSAVTYSIVPINQVSVPNQHFSEQTINVRIPDIGRGHDIPVILTLHGGNWQQSYDNNFYTTGNNSAYRNYFCTTNDSHYAHIDIQYRLISNLSQQYENCTCSGNPSSCSCDNVIFHGSNDSEPTMNDMLRDINNAIEYIISTYATILDVNNMTLWGYSAGAHLAMMYAYGGFTPNSNETYHKGSIGIVVSEAGPTHFTTGYITNDYCLCYQDYWYRLTSYLSGLDIYNETTTNKKNRYLSRISPSECFLENHQDIFSRGLKTILCYNTESANGDGIVKKNQHDDLTEAFSDNGYGSTYYREVGFEWGHNQFENNVNDTYLGDIFNQWQQLTASGE